MLEKYQSELIEHAMAVGALKFGTFTLKSGRYQSPTRSETERLSQGQTFCQDLPVLL